MEADFLGTPASTNIAVTNNAQLLRNRLYWVDLRKGGWEILGGQTWSLITPGRVGISPLPADVFYTQDMDVNYQAGLFWGRIPELRFVYHLPSNKAAFAIAIDSPDQYAGGSSGGGSITLPTLLSQLIPANWTSAPALAASPLPTLPRISLRNWPWIPANAFTSKSEEWSGTSKFGILAPLPIPLRAILLSLPALPRPRAAAGS